MTAFLCRPLCHAEELVPITNPSFEEPGDADDRAAGWDRWGEWINRECAWTPVHDGSCIIGYHHFRLEDNNNSGIFQNIAVEPGRYYTFSVRANADHPGEDFHGAKEVELRLETTLYGQQATIASKKYPAKYLATGENWSWLRVSSVAPTDTMRLLVILHPSAEIRGRAGAVKIDSARLTVQDIQAPVPAQ
ncbi:MAG: hypothetical protein EOM20_12965 [Spartobacteria bacterium]|nr:hypothetical protein [Spartobacteria bacterium]